MQNQNLPLLSISRSNYKVPKGEEQEVHYKAERVLYDSRDGVTRLSHPDLLKTNVRMFDEVKRNLELQGYTIEILYHPQGKYTNVTIPKDAKAELAEKEAQMRAKDEEIARLKAQLEATKKDESMDNMEGADGIAIEKEAQNEENAPKKRGGKTKKGE